MTTDSCYFCDLAEKKTVNRDVFYEDEHVLCMLDIDWATKGHALVVWKQHVTNVSDLTEDDYAHFSRVVHRTETALLRELDLDRSFILKSGGLISHFHFHIYPIKNDTTWEEIVNVFWKKGRKEPDPDEKEELLEKLRARLDASRIVASDSFRIAHSYLGKEVEVTMDRPIGTAHPKQGFIYEINYGYIAGERASDGEYLDAYYLGTDEPLLKAQGICIAVAHRRDNDDDKLIVVPPGMEMTNEDIMAAIAFQEKWFDTIIVR